MIQENNNKEIKSIDLLTYLTKGKNHIIESVRSSRTAEDFILFVTLSESGFKFKYYPIVTKKLRCMMVLK